MGVYEERLRSNTFWSKRVLGDPDILARFADMHRSTSPEAFANFPHFSHERKRSILATLEQRQIPVMLLLGADDTHTEPLVRSIRKDVPGAHVSFLPDCGHYIAIENPLDFNLAVSNFVGGCLLREQRKWSAAS
jgi:3-oxoadipate enol-lactonase